MTRARRASSPAPGRDETRPLLCPFCGAAEQERLPIEDKLVVIFPCMFSPVLEPQLSEEELRAALPESDSRIRIDRFVHSLSLDPVYFESSFVLVPDGTPEAYSLLHAACQELGEAGIGRLTMRTKEYPAAIHAYHGALVLTTLRYAGEVLDPASFEGLAALPEPSGKQLELAKRIIADLTGDLDITEYQDTYRERVLALIGKKRAGETIKVEKPKAAEVKELMAALEETVAKLGKQ